MKKKTCQKVVFEAWCRCDSAFYFHIRPANGFFTNMGCWFSWSNVIPCSLRSHDDTCAHVGRTLEVVLAWSPRNSKVPGLIPAQVGVEWWRLCPLDATCCPAPGPGLLGTTPTSCETSDIWTKMHVCVLRVSHRAWGGKLWPLTFQLKHSGFHCKKIVKKSKLSQNTRENCFRSTPHVLWRKTPERI